MLYILFLLYLCLFSHYIFSMEIIELEPISKNKKIKKFDEANVVASYSSQEWSKYTIKSSVIAEVINKKQLGINELPLKDQIQDIKNLKKNNLDQYQQLVSNIFTILSQKDTDELSTLKNQYYTFTQHELKEKAKELERLQQWITYFDSNEKISSPMCYFVSGIIVPSIIIEVWCLMFFGLLSIDCWN